MTLPVFRRNPHSHEYETPPRLFADLHTEFAFTVDGAALEHNAKLPRFWSPIDDGCLQPWAGERVFVNPPFYSAEIDRWVRKAARERHRGCELAVLLVPVKSDAGWWHDVVLPNAEIRFLRGRVRFFRRGYALPSTIATPCCLLIFRPPA